MGQRCCKPSVIGNLPTRIRILVEGSEDSETLNLIPDSYESLVQSVYPFAASRLSVTGSDYLILMHMRTATNGVKLSRPKEFKTALKRCKGKEMLVKITKGNYEVALDLSLQSANNPSVDEFLVKFERTLGTFKVTFIEFSHCLNRLLHLASCMSQFTLHPSVECAATAVLLTLISEEVYSEDVAGLHITPTMPFITVNVGDLKPVSIGAVRLWNDFIQTIPKLTPMMEQLKADFPTLLTILSEQFTPVKKKPIANLEHVIKAKQCFEDACTKCEATVHQLTVFFSRFQTDQSQHRLNLLHRINGKSLTKGLSSVLALYDLKGNAKGMEEVVQEDEAALAVD